VKHTEGVNVEVAFQGRAEPGLLPGVSHWPLNEGTVLRFSMSRASAEVNDNKVRIDVLNAGPFSWLEVESILLKARGSGFSR